MTYIPTSISPLQLARADYKPKLPATLNSNMAITEGEATQSIAHQKEIEEMFPHTYGLPVLTIESGPKPMQSPELNVGVILSGGQAPGGHNVIAGIFDGLKVLNNNNRLYGFLGGPSGLVDGKYIELTAPLVDEYRNTGGFDIIGSGRTKLEEQAQFDKGLQNCRELGINALVIIGGDDSNTNACVLAEYYKSINANVQVIGCPKTIDGDLKNDMIEASFGFDTACKVYSELIGNIERDALSAKKYWHFIKLMGRSASHITLECVLQTRPNYAIISEEVQEKKLTMDQIVEDIARVIKTRSDNKENFGVCLVPEGLIEFVPEVKKLISELNDLLAGKSAFFNTLETDDDKFQFVNSHISAESTKAFNSLPKEIQVQLLMDRDPHGNVQVSRIETEKLLIDMVSDKLKEWSAEGKYKGKFTALANFFGYEGRCAAPSNFDADYTYALGYTAAVIIGSGKTGYMAMVRNLTAPAEQWIAGGVPITMMMNLERRHGLMKPVIQKALVKLDGQPFKEFTKHRGEWSIKTSYIFPGPIQYFGPDEVCNASTITLELEKN
ncbi:MAG: diphosphate--fructose-6-phosphate 1-phosphotransferase [Ignavibacteriae bacterium]|nr:MAG: diphosphate--fructose-6-phosphate 1-phosphotransferase [Ignavibacteriota bacterium]